MAVTIRAKRKLYVAPLIPLVMGAANTAGAVGSAAKSVLRPVVGVAKDMVNGAVNPNQSNQNNSMNNTNMNAPQSPVPVPNAT